MPSPQELESKFWKALKSDMTLMVGLKDVDDGHTRPMTAQFENEHAPIWFFTAKSTVLAEHLLAGPQNGVASYASKGHDVFASIHGKLHIDNNRATIDRLWNAHVAAWYENGKDDPELTLIRFDADKAEIWQDGSSLIAGVKMLLGFDPKKDYADHTATVSLAS
jgi:general stress protein 26